MKKIINMKTREKLVEEYGTMFDCRNKRKDIIKKLKESEEEIERGEGIEADMVFEELRQIYGY